MSRLIKRVLAAISILLVVIAAGVGYLIFGLDPNSYKPELEKLAADNDVELNINGDLSWALFPSLAVEIGDTVVVSSRHNISPTRFQYARLNLSWRALLQREIRFQGIEVSGADITLSNVQQAQNMAVLPVVTSAVATSPAAASADSALASTTPSSGTDTRSTKSDQPFTFAVERFSLKDSRITATMNSNEALVFEQVQLTSTDFNLDGKPFPLELTFATMPGALAPLVSIPSADTSTTSQVSLSTELVIDHAGQRYQLNGMLSLDNPAINTEIQAIYNGKSDELALFTLKGNALSAAIELSASGQALQSAPSLNGSLAIDNILLKKWLAEPPAAIKNVTLSTGFSVSEQRIALTDYQLKLDQFTGSGNVDLQLEAPRRLTASLKGNELIFPAGEESGDTDSQALLTPLLAPLALLDGGKGHIEVNLNRLQQGDINITNPHLNLFANGAVLHITDLSGGIYGGKFKLDTKLNLSGKTPAASFKTQLKNIDLTQAAPQQQDVSGRINLDFSGTTAGDNADALLTNLNGSGQFSVIDPVIRKMNVERSYCELASLVEGERFEGGATAPKTWPGYTSLGELRGDLSIAKQIVTLSQLKTSLGNLAITGNGRIQLQPQIFDMRITTNLQGDRTSETGCVVKSKRIRNRDIPLHCKGSFAENGQSQCQPDEAFVKRLLAEKLSEKISEKLFKTSEKPSDNEESPASPEEQLKQKAVDTLLRGIFGQ